MKPLIDSHCHLTSSDLFTDVDEVIARAIEKGVESIVNINTDIPSLEKGLELSKRYPNIFQAAAIHPHDVEQSNVEAFLRIEREAQNGNLVAIGETGLDYHYHHSSKECQQRHLRRYLQLALKTKLPVIIHCREAFEDFFRILDEEYKIDSVYGPGVLHCFTGNMSEAKKVLERGWYLSLSGIVTFKKSVDLQEVAKIVPMDRLLIETDAPFLAPQAYRGKQNEPAYLVETAKFIAQLKGVLVEDVAEATVENAKKLFKLKV